MAESLPTPVMFLPYATCPLDSTWSSEARRRRRIQGRWVGRSEWTDRQRQTYRARSELDRDGSVAEEQEEAGDRGAAASVATETATDEGQPNRGGERKERKHRG